MEKASSYHQHFRNDEDEFIRVSGDDEKSGSSLIGKRLSSKGADPTRRSMQDGQVEETRFPISIEIPQSPQDLEENNLRERSLTVRKTGVQQADFQTSPGGHNIDSGKHAVDEDRGFDFDEDFSGKKRHRGSGRQSRS